MHLALNALCEKNKMKYVIDKKMQLTNDAAVKPRVDVLEILEMEGWKPIFLYDVSKPMLIRKIQLMHNILRFMRLGKNDIVLVQWTFELPFPLKRFKIEKLLKCKKILFVHDVESLRLQKSEFYEKDRFNQYDVLVTHTERFKIWLEESGVQSSIVINKIFDYKLENTPIRHRNSCTKFKVVFAGALNKKKSGFLYTNIEPINYTLELYGNNYNGNVNDYIHYCGSFSPDEVVYRLDGDFGLVWDGNSTESCDGTFGNYLRYNCPYKCAMYIAAQLPVIIWKQAAMAEFVVENEIGFAIDSIEDIDTVLSNMTEERYGHILDNLRKIQKDVINGEYTKGCIKQALELLR